MALPGLPPNGTCQVIAAAAQPAGTMSPHPLPPSSHGIHGPQPHQASRRQKPICLVGCVGAGVFHGFLQGPVASLDLLLVADSRFSQLTICLDSTGLCDDPRVLTPWGWVLQRLEGKGWEKNLEGLLSTAASSGVLGHLKATTRQYQSFVRA